MYLTIEQSIRQNAIRHECRGLEWTELGYDDRAKRSFEKARKFHQKADKMKLETPIDAIYRDFIAALNRNLLIGNVRKEEF